MKALIAWIMSWFVNLRATVDTPNDPTPSPSSPPSPVPAPPVVPVPGVPPTVPPPVVVPPPAPVPSPVLPSFSDSFAGGKLDTSKWIPSDWSAPGNIPGVHAGRFSPDALDFSHGCLRIKVSQTKNPDGSTTSIGGELQSRQRFGFGTYEWILRASSTSQTPEGSGRPVSGQISSGFIFQQDQGYTEIDSPEIEGQYPNQLSWTSWLTNQKRTNRLTQTSDPSQTFLRYRLVWLASTAKFYVNDSLVAEITDNIPQNPAYAMINHWGTNSQGWGGMATPGVDRYMFVKKFSFTPA